MLPVLVVFCGLILAFLYFCLGWGTNRLKDHEARKEKGEERGDPVLICWTSASGALTFTVTALQFYGALFFWTEPALRLHHLITAFLFLFPLFYFWRCLIRLFRFHGIGDLGLPKKRDTSIIAPYTEFLRPTVLSLFGIGWNSFFECLFGDFVCGVFLICFLACGVAGLGTYISVQGDLLERAKPIQRTIDNDGAAPHRV